MVHAQEITMHTGQWIVINRRPPYGEFTAYSPFDYKEAKKVFNATVRNDERLARDKEGYNCETHSIRLED
jgi:hypothetical protein